MAAMTTDVTRPSRGGRPRDPSRDGVIRAAILRLLADVGYGALTMDAVASEAGVGKATIYRRWRTKQDLVVDTISDLNRDEAAPPDTGSLEGDLRAMMRQMVTMISGPTGAATLVPALDDAAPPGTRRGLPQRPAGRLAAGLRADLGSGPSSAAKYRPDARRFARRGGHQRAARPALAADRGPVDETYRRLGARRRRPARDPRHRRARSLTAAHQPRVPGSPLNGPTTSSVIQPP